jgi:hypothetical protein
MRGEGGGAKQGNTAALNEAEEGDHVEQKDDTSDEKWTPRLNDTDDESTDDGGEEAASGGGGGGVDTGDVAEKSAKKGAPAGIPDFVPWSPGV